MRRQDSSSDRYAAALRESAMRLLDLAQEIESGSRAAGRVRLDDDTVLPVTVDELAFHEALAQVEHRSGPAVRCVHGRFPLDCPECAPAAAQWLYDRDHDHDQHDHAGEPIR